MDRSRLASGWRSLPAALRSALVAVRADEPAVFVNCWEGLEDDELDTALRELVGTFLVQERVLQFGDAACLAADRVADCLAATPMPVMVAAAAVSESARKLARGRRSCTGPPRAFPGLRLQSRRGRWLCGRRQLAGKRPWSGTRRGTARRRSGNVKGGLPRKFPRSWRQGVHWRRLRSHPSSRCGSSGGGVDYTLEEVAKHTTMIDCWVVVNTKVRDVTWFLSEHPQRRGGNADVSGQGRLAGVQNSA